MPPVLTDQASAQPRPRSVDQAVQILWISIGLIVISYIWMFPSGAFDELNKETARDLRISPQAVSIFGLCLAIGTIIPMAFLTNKIDKGRNWARIVMIVWMGLGLLAYPIGIEDNFKDPITGVLFVVNGILGILTLYLLCKKSSAEWFKFSSANISNPTK